MKIIYIVLLTLILISCFSSVYAIDLRPDDHVDKMTDAEISNGILGFILLIICCIIIGNIFKNNTKVALILLGIAFIIFLIYF